MTARRKKGATLGLIPVFLLVSLLIGFAMFLIAELFGGSRELTNATDSGALAAARNLLAVGLKSSEIASLPPEFQSLGVDDTGAPAGVDASTGLAPSNAIFNIYAFNRAAGLTLLVALNAAEDGSPGAIQNANTLISALNQFGTNLNNDLAKDSSFIDTFAHFTSGSQNAMLGGNIIDLGNNEKIQFASVQGQGKANIYFNSSMYSNDPIMANWISQLTVNSGSMSQVNGRYNTAEPGAQTGQPFVKGYQTLDMNAVTGQKGFSPSLIFTTAVNPNTLPHMINVNRFTNTAVPSTCYAPTNSLSTQGIASGGTSNLMCTALACAMLGAGDNQYPITMPYGWIRIKNNPDAVTANQGNSSPLPPVPYYAEFGESIFNQQLWLGAGGYGGINLANNGVFCTEQYENAANPLDQGPAGYSGKAELAAWVTYNTTPCTNPNYKDTRGLDSRLNPSIQQPDGSYVFDNVQSPTPNLRISANYNQNATVNDMYGVTSIVAYCNSNMYVAGSTPTICQNNFNTWMTNYQGTNYGELGPYDTGSQGSGGLTNLEYLKGEVLGAFYTFIDTYYSKNDPSAAQFSFTLTTPQSPSGSKVYARSTAVDYSTPSAHPTVAFGTVGTPSDLLNQLYEYNASCANVNDSNQWNNVGTPLGKLMQRCQQILPGASESDVAALLSTYPIDLNQYQYIYLPPGASKLTISQTPPGFLKPYPEYAKPGSTVPDGTTTLTCQDSTWDRSGTYTQGNQQLAIDIMGTAINTNITNGGGAYKGDGNTDYQPYMSFTGTLATYDAVNWTSNSGRNYFLGELSFGNYVNGTNGSGGSAGTFTQPN